MPAAEAPDTRSSLWPLVAACVVATLAFWAYSRTLLPGVDLGDTGGFQAAVLWPEPSARRAYPLYYALATPFTATLSPANPARGLNLFSALWAAVAAGLLTFFVSRLTSSTLAGIAAGLLLAFSQTFWTQAVIAEVYSLHLTLIAACLLALYAWARHPTTARLAIFFAVYALAFGNHLSMILLLVPCTLFVFQVHATPRELLRPLTIALAVGIAIAGALQYSQNAMYVWSSIEAPSAWTDRLAGFWVDATKADWREEMVLGVPASEIGNRIAMWAWDSRQQFGVVGLALAIVGAVRLWSLDRPWAVFVWTAYAISTLFALSYNVGDTHVFLLPGHFFTALAAGTALAPLKARGAGGVDRVVGAGRRRVIQTASGLALLYAAWLGWSTWPVVDRHTDRRADAFLAHLTQGIDERNALLVSKMDWQLENVVLYSGRYERRGLAWVRLLDVFPYFPFLVRDNHAEDRDVVLTAEAANDVRTAYGGLFPLVQDQPSAPTLTAVAEQIPRGAPYVLTWLSPVPGGAVVDPADINRAVGLLAQGSAPARSEPGYEVWAGVAGERPAFHRSSARPFVERFAIAGDEHTVRMDSWLPQDTFRRGGFGHVLRGRDRLLWIERGLSLVWLSRSGTPAQAYVAGLYTPQPRFRIEAPSARFARIASSAVQ